MFNPLQTFPNLCENLYLKLMSFFNLEVLKGKPTKSIKIMPRLKISKKKNWEKNIEKIIIKLQLIWTYENMVKFLTFKSP